MMMMMMLTIDCLQNGLHPSGPIRPMPLVPSANLIETKNLPPSYLGLGAAAAAAAVQHPHLLQIQTAMAVMAQRQAAEQGFPQTAPFRHAPPPQGYPLYPWQISRHGRFPFPHFPGSKYLNPISLSPLHSIHSLNLVRTNLTKMPECKATRRL